MYRKVIGISTYEYFEKRFGFLARLYGSLAFMLAHFSKMGTVFYLLALAIASMMGFTDPNFTYYVILVLGIMVVTYTLLGGIEAVIWCDVIQGLLLMGGGLICVAVLLFKPDEGAAAVLSRAWDSGKISFGPFDWSFVKLTFWVMAINGVFYAIQKYGTDQTIVQRYLTAGSDKKAVRASLIGVLLCVPVWTLFIFIGTLVWSFYQTMAMPAEIAEAVAAKPERAFTYFVTTQLPIGVTGMILAALCAAALSSLDSDLNCLSAVLVEDYYKRLRPGSSDRQRLVTGRIAVGICGAAAMGVACWYVASEGKSVLSIVFALYAIFSGGIAGLFALAFFTRRANWKGVYFGMAACVLFTAWALLTSKPIIGDKKVLDLNEMFGVSYLNFTHHKYMLGVYSHIVLFVVGYVASLFFKVEKTGEGLTFYDWRKKDKPEASVD
jgi:SSS family solute:Na+ symporter